MNKVLFLVLIIVAASCLSEVKIDRDYPVLITNPVQSITERGALFSADVSTEATEEIIDHGFIWGTEMDPRFNSETSFTRLGKLSTRTFGQEINSPLSEGFIYRVRAFAQTQNKTIYSNVVEFKSLGGLAPIINQIEPLQATIGSVITINGQYFSSRISQNQVLIDGNVAEIIEATDKSMKVFVPFVTARKPSVTISVLAMISKVRNDLVEITDAPRIKQVTNSLTSCKTFILSGENFPIDPSLKVLVNGKQIDYVSLGNSTINITLAGSIPNSIDFSLIWFEKYITFYRYKYITPEITNIPTLLSTDLTYTISGINFPTCISDLSANFICGNNNVTSQILSGNQNELQIQIPNFTSCFETTIRLEISLNGNLLTSAEIFYVP